MGKAEEKTKQTSYQRFTPQVITRAGIRNAPYNPRRITEDARARLKAKIEVVGLVNTFVWNRRTGNLVGGHQRLSILDELEGNQDYTLTVSVVDVDEREEKELNVFLNNTATMGDWDAVELGKLAAEFKEDLGGLGFAPGELDFLKNESATAQDEGAGAGGPPPPRVTQDKTQIVVVFRDAAETEAFLRYIGAALDTRYVDAGKHFARRGFKPEQEAEVKP